MCHFCIILCFLCTLPFFCGTEEINLVDGKIVQKFFSMSFLKSQNCSRKEWLLPEVSRMHPNGHGAFAARMHEQAVNWVTMSTPDNWIAQKKPFFCPSRYYAKDPAIQTRIRRHCRVPLRKEDEASKATTPQVFKKHYLPPRETKKPVNLPRRRKLLNQVVQTQTPNHTHNTTIASQRSNGG